VLDRLLHYATTLNIKGESYRLKEKRRAGLLGRPNFAVSEEQQVPAP
jgi:IstB-like ATP binding protein